MEQQMFVNLWATQQWKWIYFGMIAGDSDVVWTLSARAIWDQLIIK
ncbi:MAG: hypothetical protein H6612_04435 [Ignavibacteriales bacterium]|nr:hypothetical protein [Ignavibacteriales bacterium]